VSKPDDIRCEHCGHPRAEHHPAIPTVQRPFDSPILLLCPTAVFQATGYDVDGQPYRKDKDITPPNPIQKAQG